MEELYLCNGSLLLLLTRMRISGGSIVGFLLMLGGGNKLEGEYSSGRM